MTTRVKSRAPSVLPSAPQFLQFKIAPHVTLPLTPEQSGQANLDLLATSSDDALSTSVDPPPADGMKYQRGDKVQARRPHGGDWQNAVVDWVYAVSQTYRVVFDDAPNLPGYRLYAYEVQPRPIYGPSATEYKCGDKVQARFGGRAWRDGTVRHVYAKARPHSNQYRIVFNDDRTAHVVSAPDVRPRTLDETSPAGNLDLDRAREEIARLKRANSAAAVLLERLGINNEENGNAVLAWLDGEGPEVARSNEGDGT